jgi:hypothetical protein
MSPTPLDTDVEEFAAEHGEVSFLNKIADHKFTALS